MADNDRYLELLAESLIKQDAMIDELKGVNKRLGHVEEDIQKLNLLTAENNRPIIKLANALDILPEVLTRLTKLEVAVFH